MATIIGVHGTYAHMNDGVVVDGAAVDNDLWWKPGSTFEQRIKSLVASDAGGGAATPVSIEPFVWSGDNSERERRIAGLSLLDRLQELEAKGEPYCIVGHSHGGSVISAALLRAASRRMPLPNLRRWVTVGTPFIGMRPQPRLIDRINLVQRVVLVASMMLLIMFLLYMAGQVITYGLPFTGAYSNSLAVRNIVAGVLMSLPAVFFTIAYEIVDRRHLFFYRTATIERARAFFGERWLSFTHPSDEAVQGLRSLPGATLQVFDRNFAAQRLTTIAVIALPVAYLYVLFSPPLMLDLAGFMKNRVYKVDEYAARGKAYDVERRQVRAVAATAAKPGTAAATGTAPPSPTVDWNEVRRQREDLKRRFPDYVQIARAERYRRQFLEDDNGKPCANQTLCGGGESFTINSSLLYHIASDEVTSALINDDTRFGIYSELILAAVPMVLVPLMFIAISLLLLLLFGWLAWLLSAMLSVVLNRVTLSEIKREIYGNDTGGEVAFGAGPRPLWMHVGRPYLPADIAQLLTDQADKAASMSLSKFRNAISAIAMAQGRPPSGGIVSSYLTWRELIHSTYFELPEFRLLFARAVSAEKGFAPTPAFADDKNYGRAEAWLTQVDTASTTPAAMALRFAELAPPPPTAGGPAGATA